MSDNDGRKANGVGAINANDGNSHNNVNVNVNESSPKVVADASKRGTSEGKNATKIPVEDRANQAIAQSSNGGSSSSNENRLELMQEPGRDTKTSFVNSARVHCSSLALLAHLWGGKFWFLDVNANHVSLEKTGPIQNTLAGNPTRSDTANAESIDSSVVAAIITNKPEKGCAEVTDKHVQTKLVNPLDGSTCNNLVCTPSKQTSELKAFGALTREELIDLFQYNLFTDVGRINFVGNYNATVGTNNIVWTQDNENKLNEQYASNEMAIFYKFFAFKAEFDKVSTLMISMLEGNHRLLCLLFTLAGRKVHALTNFGINEPTKLEKLTTEYLKVVGKHTNENVLGEEGATWVMKEVEAFMTSGTEALMVNMNLTVPLVSNSSSYPVSELLEQCMGESKKYAETKKNSSERSDFAVIAEILGVAYQIEDGKARKKFNNVRKMPNDMTVGDGVRVAVTPPSREDDRREWVNLIMTNLTVEEAEVKLELAKEDGKKKTWVYPLKQENFKQMANGESRKTDLSELNLIVIGRRVLDHCMKKCGCSSQDTIDQLFETMLMKCGFNLSADRRWMRLVKMGEDGNRGVAAAAFVLSMHTVGGLYDRQIEVYDFFKTLGIAHLDQTQYWNGLRICYGLMCALTDIQYRVIFDHTCPKASPNDCDKGFFRNMLLWGNMKKLLEFFTMFGYNPTVRNGLKEDDLPDIKEVRDYFLGEASDETYAALRKVIGDFGEKEWKKKVGARFGRNIGWSHLYTSEHYSQVNPSDKGLSVLHMYVLNLAIKLQMFEDSDEGRSDWNPDKVAKMKELGLYMHGNEFQVKKDDGKRMGLKVRKGEDLLDIVDPAVFVPEGNKTCPDVVQVGAMLFKRRDTSAEINAENVAKMKLEWVAIQQLKQKRKASNDNQETDKQKRAKISVSVSSKTIASTSTMSKSQASSMAKQLLEDKASGGAIAEVLSKVLMEGEEGKYGELYNLVKGAVENITLIEDADESGDINVDYWNDNESINNSDDSLKRRQEIYLPDALKEYLLERIDRQDYVATLDWSNKKLASLIIKGDVPRYTEDGDDSLVQLKHLIYWMKVNLAFFSVIVEFTLVNPEGEEMKKVGLAEDSRSDVQLDSSANMDRDAIESLRIDENSTEELRLHGINIDQYHIPVINQLLVSKAGGGYKFQGYIVNEVRVNEHAFDKSSDEKALLCRVCYTWVGSRWRYCDECTPDRERLSEELKEYNLDTNSNSQDVDEGIRYKRWRKRKRFQRHLI